MSSESVFERFRHRFRQPAEETLQAPEVSSADLRQEIMDARRFRSTASFEKYRDALLAEVAKLRPEPQGGMEAAAACAFTRAGLEKAIGILDSVAAMANEEMIEDGH